MEKPQISSLALADLIDAEGLRQALAALARSTPDAAALRQGGLEQIKAAFTAGRDKVRTAVEENGLQGLVAARALSALQDAVIHVIYDFAVQHVYPTQSRAAAERLAIVATGGYGRGELAPGSDIDLLFVRPFKQTAWGESVIEFILYMLWDLGLKVGHATRSLAECVRLAKQDVTIRTALAGSALSVGRSRPVRRSAQEILGRNRHRQRARTSSKPNWRSATPAICARAKAAIWSNPTSRRAKAGCATCRRSIGSANISITSKTPPIWSSTTSSPRDEYKTFQKAEAFLWDVRVHLHYLLGRAEERLSFDVQPELARAARLSPTTIRAAPSKHFMRAYFLVAKDVGDLTRIFCAALEEQNRKHHPVAGQHAAGLP